MQSGGSDADAWYRTGPQKTVEVYSLL